MSALLRGGSAVHRVDLAEPNNVFGQTLIRIRHIIHGNEPRDGELERHGGWILQTKASCQSLLSRRDRLREPIPAQHRSGPSGLWMDGDELRGRQACLAGVRVADDLSLEDDMSAGRNRGFPVGYDRRIRDDGRRGSGLDRDDGMTRAIGSGAVFRRNLHGWSPTV